MGSLIIHGHYTNFSPPHPHPPAPKQTPSGTWLVGNPPAHPQRRGPPALSEGDIISWGAGEEAVGRAGCPCLLHIGLGRRERKQEHRDGQGLGPRPKSLSSCLSTRRTVKNWPHSGQFPQLRPCLAPISSNRKDRKWVGGVRGQRGHRNLARVALVVQPLLA